MTSVSEISRSATASRYSRPRWNDLAPAASSISASVNGSDPGMPTIEHGPRTRWGASRQQEAPSGWLRQPALASVTASGGTDEPASFWLAGQAWPNVNIVAIRRGRRARGLTRSGGAPATASGRCLTTPRPEGRGFQPSPAGVPVSRPAAPGRSRNVLRQLRRQSPRDQAQLREQVPARRAGPGTWVPAADHDQVAPGALAFAGELAAEFAPAAV